MKTLQRFPGVRPSTPKVGQSFLWPVAWALLLVAGCCTGCQKADVDPTAITPAQTDFSLSEEEKKQSAAPGLGGSTAQPTGQALTLPTGLQVSNTILGSDGQQPDSVFQIGGNDYHYVDLAFELINTTSKPIRVILPGGLIFVSSDKSRQNGLLVQADTLLIKPGVKAVRASLYCLNDNRQAADMTTAYQIGPVTQYPALLNLLRLLSTKSGARWSTLSVSQMIAYSSLVQDAVWQVAHTGKLPDGLRSQLDGLP